MVSNGLVQCGLIGRLPWNGTVAVYNLPSRVAAIPLPPSTTMLLPLRNFAISRICTTYTMNSKCDLTRREKCTLREGCSLIQNVCLVHKSRIQLHLIILFCFCGPDPTCILLPPSQPSATIPHMWHEKIKVCLATRFDTNITEIGKYYQPERTTQWGKVRRLEGGDDMKASSLVKVQEDTRDATWIKASDSAAFLSKSAYSMIV